MGVNMIRFPDAFPSKGTPIVMNDFYKDSHYRGSVCSDFLMIPPKKRTPQYKMKFLNSLSQGVNMIQFFENVN